jgi:hypothetical protein
MISLKADASIQEVLDDMTALDPHAILLLPPRGRAEPGLNEALAKGMLEDVLGRGVGREL